MAELRNIWLYDENGGEIDVKDAELVSGKGLRGDRHFNKENPVSILAISDDVAKEEDLAQGLCLSKFKANLYISGLSVSEGEMTNGLKINIGEALLQISGKKHCYPNCQLNADGKSCSLRGAAVFCIVILGGVIRQGDEVHT